MEALIVLGWILFLGSSAVLVTAATMIVVYVHRHEIWKNSTPLKLLNTIVVSGVATVVFALILVCLTS